MEWADLRGVALEGHFRKTVSAWRASGGGPTVSTGLEALEALDDAPSLEPGLIIAHASRCGSSLLAALAASGEGGVLVAEPSLLPDIMSCDLAGGLGRPADEVLRQAVRALGRIRFGTERRLVLKLNSQMVRHLPVLRRAFPAAPVVWLQRRPAEIVESNLRRPPAGSIRPEAAARQALRRAALVFMGATAFVGDDVPVLDYRDLPDAAWTRVAGLMGLEPSPADLARLADVARRDARTGEPYAPRPIEPLPEAMQAAVRDTLDPMYEALAERGRRQVMSKRLVA